MGLILAPYIAPRQADSLRDAGVSWIDLSGNMAVRVGAGVYIERTGRPNQFPDTAPIKKVFQGTASLVARALLLQPGGFSSLSDIVAFIQARNGRIAVSTVSKVLRSLEEQLLVSKSGPRIASTDAAALLERLAEGYAANGSRRQLRACRFAVENARQTIREFCSTLDCSYIVCGFYAARLRGLAASAAMTMYVTDLERAKEAAGRLAGNCIPDEEFGQLRIMETRERTPWFNAQTVDEIRVVDEIELYLEMTVDTPRGPKVAALLRPRVLEARADE